VNAMRTLLPGFVVLAIFPSAGFAATFESQGYRVTIPAGEVHEEDLSCTTGKLLSGGYVIDSAIRRESPSGKISVIASTPFNDSGWYVGFQNSHDAPIAVEFRIALLCG
jgi:hypothetical protein